MERLQRLACAALFLNAARCFQAFRKAFSRQAPAERELPALPGSLLSKGRALLIGSQLPKWSREGHGRRGRRCVRTDDVAREVESVLEAGREGPRKVWTQALSCGDYAAIFAQVPEVGEITETAEAERVESGDLGTKLIELLEETTCHRGLEGPKGPGIVAARAQQLLTHSSQSLSTARNRVTHVWRVHAPPLRLRHRLGLPWLLLLLRGGVCHEPRGLESFLSVAARYLCAADAAVLHDLMYPCVHSSGEPTCRSALDLSDHLSR